MKISTGMDLDVVALEQRDEFTLLVELTAPDTPSEAERIPATLQVVLDRSGSMGGGRLGGARTALLSLVDRLEPTDNLGVVAFDDEATLVVPAGPLSDKAAVKAAIAAVHPGGRTDLSAGYLRGLQEARRVAGPAGATVLLISDGHANAGIVDSDRLGAVATGAHRHGVTTSTLGFGLGYDERLLAALARGGQGNELFAEEADTAGALIAGEVDGLLDHVAQAASLLIRTTSAVEAVAVLNQLPTTTVDGGLMAELGSFYAGETRKLVLTFAVPGIAALGLAQIATLDLTHVSLPDLVQHTASLPVHVNVVPGDQASGRIRDPAVRAEALYQRTQHAKRRSGELLGEGRTDEAVRLLHTSSAGLRAQAPVLPLGYSRELILEAQLMTDMAGEVHAGFASRAAKSSSYDATRKSRSRGRRATGELELRWARDHDAPGAAFRLEEWRLQRLARLAPTLTCLLHPQAALDERDVDQLARLLDPTDPLRDFLAEAATHGGATLRRA